MVGQRRRPRRRRAPGRRLAPVLALAGMGAIVAVLAVATMSQISPASHSYRRTVDSGYSALVAPLVERSNSVAAGLTAVLKRGPGMQRSTFFSDLDTLASSSKDLARQYDAIASPSPAARAATWCAQAFDGRAIASAELRGALEGLLGGSTGAAKAAGDEASAGAAMTSAGREFESDDALWVACRSGLRRAPGAPTLAASRWVTDSSSWTSAAVTAFVAAVTASPTLASVERMTVLNCVVTPSPLQAASGQVLVPPTTGLEVQADVANEGNVELTGVKVTASLTGPGVGSGTGASASSATVVSARRMLDIDAGTSEAIGLPPLSVVPGVSYSLQVQATSRGSTTPALDNLVLVVDAAVSQTTVLTSLSPVQVGRTVTYTASVSTSLDGLPRASGTIEFEDDSSAIPTCSAQTLSNGQATCSVSYPSAGTHVITAQYSGDPSRSASTSAPLIEAVVPEASRHRSATASTASSP